MKLSESSMAESGKAEMERQKRKGRNERTETKGQKREDRGDFRPRGPVKLSQKLFYFISFSPFVFLCLCECLSQSLAAC